MNDNISADDFEKLNKAIGGCLQAVSAHSLLDLKIRREELSKLLPTTKSWQNAPRSALPVLLLHNLDLIIDGLEPPEMKRNEEETIIHEI